MSVTFTTALEAAHLYTTGKADKGSILSYAKSANLVKDDVLLLLSKGALDISEASALLREPKSESRKVYFKVGQKGGISCYGLQRMPVTLYLEQWESLYSQAGSEIPKDMKELIGKEHEIKEADFKTDEQKSLLDSIKAGKRTKARYANGKVYVQVRLKSDGE